MLICITNRKLCTDDFHSRIAAIAAAKPTAILLREKDLSDADYIQLAQRCASICKTQGVTLICNRLIVDTDFHTTLCSQIQLPFPIFRQYPRKQIPFENLGVSVHSPEEAYAAQEQGADFLIAGHIFQTDCKRDLPPRGLNFLHDVCNACTIPVFGIGGMTPERTPAVRAAGAAGICVMSTLMTCEAPYETTLQYVQAAK